MKKNIKWLLKEIDQWAQPGILIKKGPEILTISPFHAGFIIRAKVDGKL